MLIEYVSNRDGKYEIYAMLSDGTAQTRITNNPGADDTSLTRPFLWMGKGLYLSQIKMGLMTCI
jgi:hypothetical protein